MDVSEARAGRSAAWSVWVLPEGLPELVRRRGRTRVLNGILPLLPSFLDAALMLAKFAINMAGDAQRFLIGIGGYGRKARGLYCQQLIRWLVSSALGSMAQATGVEPLWR